MKEVSITELGLMLLDLLKKISFLEICGFDEDINFGPDAWDFDRWIKEISKVGIIKAHLYHNEREFNITWYLRKKGHYSNKLCKYIGKWGTDDPEIKKQFGMRCKLINVFVENGKWVKLLRHPAKTFGICFLRFMVGITYLRARR